MQSPVASEPLTLLPSGIVVDPSRREVRRPDGTVVELAEREAELLAYLARREGEVVGRADLLREVWRVRPTTRTKAVEMCVRRLRERIELDPDEPRHLLTVRGTGYRLVAAGRAAPPPLGRRPELAPDLRPLVGRAAELEALADAVRRGARLVTVVGPAGVGKSRLVREWARAARPGDVWPVDLGEEHAAESLLRALARAFGCDADPERLAAGIAGLDRAVLFADAAEGCADALAAVVGRLLVEAPQLTVIATSRRPTRAPEEVVLRLEPLGEAEMGELLRSRVDRPLPDVEKLVARLDGLPLAAELAAGRLGLYTCAELAARLEDGSGVLRATGGGRHASLHRALPDSWRVLEPEDRRLLGQLSVFRGGFTLEAARAVLDVADGERRVLELVEASLVRVEAPSGARAARFRLFDAVRELAEELADAADLDGAVERHAAWFLAPLDPLWPARIGVEEEDRWIDDPANLIVAVERAIPRWPRRALFGLLRLWQPALTTATDYSTLERLATGVAAALDPADRVYAEMVLADALQYRMLRDDAERVLERALEAAQQLAPPMVRWVKAVWAAWHWLGGSAEQGIRWFEEALAEARQVGDLACQAYVLRRQGELGIAEDAERALAEALAAYRQLGDTYGELQTELAVGKEAALHLRPAADRMAEACARWSAHSRQRLTETTYHSIALAFFMEDRLLEARAWELEHLRTAERQGKVYSIAPGYELLGMVELELGHLDAAHRALLKLLRLLDGRADRRAVPLRATAHVGLGLAAFDQGDLPQARAHFALAPADDDLAALSAGAWVLAGGGEEARARLEASRGDPVFELGEALSQLSSGGGERLDQALAHIPDRRLTRYELSCRLMARVASRVCRRFVITGARRGGAG